MVAAGLVVAYAFRSYAQGEGGFKLGVDLAGGTDLIYEIDLDKFTDEQEKDPQQGPDHHDILLSTRRALVQRSTASSLP